MNSPTGYELELNQARQADIRREIGGIEKAKQVKVNGQPKASRVGSAPARPGKKAALAGWLIKLAIVSGLVVAVMRVTGLAQAANLNSPLNSPLDSPMNSPVQQGYESGYYGTVQAEPGQLPLGSYLTRISLSDIPVQLREEYAPARRYAGMWELKFREDNHFTASVKNRVVFNGEIRQSGPQQITFTSGFEAAVCQSDQEKEGVYSWSFDGTSLKLEAVSEHCYERALSLASHPLKLTALKKEIDDGPQRRGIPRFF